MGALERCIPATLVFAPLFACASGPSVGELEVAERDDGALEVTCIAETDDCEREVRDRCPFGAHLLLHEEIPASTHVHAAPVGTTGAVAHHHFQVPARRHVVVKRH